MLLVPLFSPVHENRNRSAKVVRNAPHEVKLTMRATSVSWLSRKPVGSVYFCRISPRAIGGDPSQLKACLTKSGYAEVARKLQAIKVGYIREGGMDAVARRVQSFNTGSPFEIELHKAVQCKEPEMWEAILHEKYKKDRIKLEWFDITDEAIDSSLQVIARHDTDGHLSKEFESLVTKKRQTRSKNGPGKEATSSDQASLSPQEVLRRYQGRLSVFPKAYLDQKDMGIIMEILKKHPEADKKIGVGVDSIFVAATSFPNSCCFHVKRIDGSEEDFSYRMCLKLKRDRRRHYTHTTPPKSTLGQHDKRGL